VEYKPSIFIGSSSEGLVVAEAVKQAFADFDEVDIWTEGVFGLNQAYLESLLRAANLYDFAILCLTADDLVESRGITQKAPRDNLVFELGLFMGRMGVNRAFILCEDSIKILSDFEGIAVTTFQHPQEGSLSAVVRAACQGIRQSMESALQKSEPGFLPSTALAIGYFENFISKIYEALVSRQEFFIENPPTGAASQDGQPAKPVIYDSFSLNIIIPHSLDDLEQNNLRWIVRDLKQIVLKTGFRRFPFYVESEVEAENPDGSGKRRLVLFDIPTTLLASRKVIQMLVGGSAIGDDLSAAKLEQREILNFEKTLRYKLKGYRNVAIQRLEASLDLG
jgi:hypothetical protein